MHAPGMEDMRVCINMPAQAGAGAAKFCLCRGRWFAFMPCCPMDGAVLPNPKTPGGSEKQNNKIKPTKTCTLIETQSPR